jgi:phosphohistidine phosphatase
VRIFLLRHGDAGFEADSDALRTLSSRGKADVWNVARQLASRQDELQTMLVSPYLRARQTAEQFANVVSINSIKESDKLTPEADSGQALALLEQNASDSLLVVSHNPLVSRLISLLVEGSPQPDHYLDTSQLACVETEVIAPGCGRMLYELLPRA